MYKGIADYSTDIVWIKCADSWNKHVDCVIPENNLDTWYLMVMYTGSLNINHIS